VFDIHFSDAKVVSLSGRFSAAVTGDADKILNQVTGDCVVDLKNLDYISSAGIGSFLRTYKRLKEGGHSLKLINVNQHIKEVIKYSGLDRVLIIE